MNSPEKNPPDLRQESELAQANEAAWLPILRQLRSGEGAPLPEVTRKPGAFPAGEFVLIAGPCAVDDHLEETLTAVADLGITWVRGGAWKPRTFPWSFQGHGLEGLRRMRAFADKRGLKVVSEIVSEKDVDAAVPLVDVVQVGARNCQNFSLLRLLAQKDKPVLLKRGAACTVEEWLGAAAYLDGRVPVTLCERGIRGFDPSFRNQLDLPGAVLAQRLGGFQTIVDPSHGTGIAELVAPMVHAARACGLDGAIVEVHACPEASPSDADQALRLADFRSLLAELAEKSTGGPVTARPAGARRSGSVSRTL
ncbi:MAG: 3-deoxy-7-phosphoheptulonate synthase [Planctomycetota bacterium]